MTDRIDLKGIEVYAKHGVLTHEQEKAQVFRVDATVFSDFGPAAESDDLSDTLDYSMLAMEVREVVGSESYKLIETVATRVSEALMSHPQVTRSIVTIHKPDAPMDVVFEDVSVTVERARGPSVS